MRGLACGGGSSWMTHLGPDHSGRGDSDSKWWGFGPDPTQLLVPEKREAFTVYSTISRYVQEPSLCYRDTATSTDNVARPNAASAASCSKEEPLYFRHDYNDEQSISDMSTIGKPGCPPPPPSSLGDPTRVRRFRSKARYAASSGPQVLRR